MSTNTKNEIRILGGMCKGTVLKVPPSARPTSAIVRQSVFNRIDLQPQSRFLDLFAGSGSMGCEALSRGCLQVDFVENNRQTHTILRENTKLVQERITKQGLPPPDVNVSQMDALKLLRTSQDLYDLIWADPPYDHLGAIINDLINLASARLAPGGLFLLEAPDKLAQNLVPGEHRTFGQTTLLSFPSHKESST